MAFFCNGKQGICECDILCGDCPFSDDTGGKFVTTNGERIRGMTDAELEPLLLAIKLGYAPWCDHHCENEGDDGCDNCILAWLQQPAKED